MTALQPPADEAEEALKCPSAQPEFEDAQVLGVIKQSDDGPRLAYAAGHVAATPDVVEATGPVPPTLVMRFAGKCETQRCVHFKQGACSLVGRIVDGLAPVTGHLPACAIRKSCRWYAQEGDAACQRCPQVVTRLEHPDDHMRAVADGP